MDKQRNDTLSTPLYFSIISFLTKNKTKVIIINYNCFIFNIMHNINAWKANNEYFLQRYVTNIPNGLGEITYGITSEKKNVDITDEVDLTTFDLYMKDTDDRIGKIFFSMILVRPLKTIIKTMYHLCLPISIPREIYISILRDNKSNINYLKLAINATGKTVVDIIRTPLYGIVLTIVAVCGSLAFFVKKDSLKNLRKLHGQIELSLHWGNKFRCLVECFLPKDNLMKLGRRNQPIQGITSIRLKVNHMSSVDVSDYLSENDPVILGLANFAHSQLKKNSSLKEIILKRCF
jgi:hypothetical protein